MKFSQYLGFSTISKIWSILLLKGQSKSKSSAPSISTLPCACSHQSQLFPVCCSFLKRKTVCKKKNRCTTKSQANKSNRWSALFGYTLALVQVTKKNSYENSDVELCMHCKTTQLMFKIWIAHWQYIGSWWVAMDFYLQRVSVFRWGCAKNMWYNWSVDYFWSIS